jgi:thioredoxin 1
VNLSECSGLQSRGFWAEITPAARQARGRSAASTQERLSKSGNFREGLRSNFNTPVCFIICIFGGQEARSVSDNIVYLTDESFQTEVLDSTEPVLVDYWAEWCGPCKMIAPILTEIADEYQGKVKIAKLNIDENPQTPPRYGIRGIPTLMLFKNGNVEATKVGALSKSQLTAFIDTNL